MAKKKITLSRQQLDEIRDHIIPANEYLKKVGSLKGFKGLQTDVVQRLHVAAYGFKYDQGCPSCLGDTLRMLTNIWQETAGKQEAAKKAQQAKQLEAARKKKAEQAKAKAAAKQGNDDGASDQPPPSPGDLQPGEEDPS
jgi:hypothetical protein